MINETESVVGQDWGEVVDGFCCYCYCHYCVCKGPKSMSKLKSAPGEYKKS